MKKAFVVLMEVALLLTVVTAQKKPKPWTEWSEKEAQKILDDSPWGQTQTETDTSDMFFTPTTQGAPRGATQGVTNQATNVNYHIRFLSSRMIRRAFARTVMHQQKTPNASLPEGLRSFVERDFDQWVVVAVTFDSADRRFSGPALQAFNSANMAVLQNNTYLELPNGKRVFVQDYKAPINDGLGAKFIFPRVVDGQPLLSSEAGDVRFVSDVGTQIKLNMRFKVAAMMNEGKLDY